MEEQIIVSTINVNCFYPGPPDNIFISIKKEEENILPGIYLNLTYSNLEEIIIKRSEVENSINSKIHEELELKNNNFFKDFLNYLNTFTFKSMSKISSIKTLIKEYSFNQVYFIRI